MNQQSYGKLVTAVRLLLGMEFLVNGLNWWVKLITPYPSISDGVASLPPGDFVLAMINTGIIFHLVKALELIAGVALLTNLFVPLALVAVFSVTVNVFIVDVFMGHKLRSYIMGGGALLMNGFLILAYFERYRSMLAMRATADALDPDGRGEARPDGIGRVLGIVNPVLALASALVGTIMVGWVTIMIVQHFTGDKP